MAQEQLFHIGVKGLIRNKDGLYLCVKSSQGFFDIPGGRISENEDWEFTLFRELREELCVPSDAYIVSSEPIPLHTNRFTQKEPRSVKLFILIYHCELKDDISILLNEENTDYSWETARDLYEKVDILQSVPLETLFT